MRQNQSEQDKTEEEDKKENKKEDKEGNKNLTKNKSVLIFIFCFGFLLSLSLSLFFIKDGNDLLHQKIINITEERKAALSQRIQINFEVLLSLKSFYRASDNITREDFYIFTKELLLKNPSIQAFQWLPKVPESDRIEVESIIQAEGFNDFQIKERKNGKMIRAESREFYYPVYYVEPLLANKSVLGFDVGSSLIHLATLKKARDQKKMIASAAITLNQEEVKQKVIQVFLPVFDKALNSKHQSQQNIIGYAFAIFRIGDMFEQSLLDNAQEHTINFVLSDVTNNVDNINSSNELEVLHKHTAELLTNVQKEQGSGIKVTMDLAGRTWQLEGQATQQLIEQHRTAQPFIIFIIGLLLTGTLTFYLYREMQKKDEIERQVNKRSKQLKQAFSQKKVVQQQLIQTERLASLGAMVAGVAHEINTPVGLSVTNASELKETITAFKKMKNNEGIDEDDLDNFLDNSDMFLTLIQNNLTRAAELVRSFKQVAVDQTSSEDRNFNLKEQVQAILDTQHHEFKKTHIQIKLECRNDLIIISNPGAFSQIISNLTTNSRIHAFDSGDQGGLINIELHTSVDDNGENRLKLNYRDNGKGVNKELQSKFFDPFFTTRRDQGGSGLGTHIVHNIVTQTLQGGIKFSSQLGEGILIQIDIPVVIATFGGVEDEISAF